MGFKIASTAAFLSFLCVTSALPYGGGTKGAPIRNYDQVRDQNDFGASGDISWGQEGLNSGLQHEGFAPVQQSSNDELFAFEDMDTEKPGYGEPDSGVNHFDQQEFERETDLGPPGHPPKETAHESESWLQKLAKKWNKLKHKTSNAAESVGRSVQTWYKNIHNKVPKIWEEFKRVLSEFGLMIHRGAAYVVHKISLTVDEVKASKLIKKLEQRLVEGDEMVDEFFQKVGVKMTQWMQQNQHANVDEGLFKENTDYSQQFSQVDFPDIFQDPEIHGHLDKMVAGGVITQLEMDMFYEEKDHGTSGSAPVQIEAHSPAIDLAPYQDEKVDSVSNPKDLGESEFNTGPHHTVKKELLNDASQSQDSGYPSDVSPVKPHIPEVLPHQYSKLEENLPQSVPQIEEHPSGGYAVDEVPPQEYPEIEEPFPQLHQQIDEHSSPQGKPQIDEYPSGGYAVDDVPPQEYPEIDVPAPQRHSKDEHLPQEYPSIDLPSQGYPEIGEPPSQEYPQTGSYPSYEGPSTSQQSSKGQQLYFPSVW